MLLKKLNYFLLPLIVFFLFLSKSTFAENKLLMITADYCIYCQIWEKEIGKIYPKTDISKSFPLEKIELDEYLFDNDINDTNNYEKKLHRLLFSIKVISKLVELQDTQVLKCFGGK